MAPLPALGASLALFLLSGRPVVSQPTLGSVGSVVDNVVEAAGNHFNNALASIDSVLDKTTDKINAADLEEAHSVLDVDLSAAHNAAHEVLEDSKVAMEKVMEKGIGGLLEKMDSEALKNMLYQHHEEESDADSDEEADDTSAHVETLETTLEQASDALGSALVEAESLLEDVKESASNIKDLLDNLPASSDILDSLPSDILDSLPSDILDSLPSDILDSLPSDILDSLPASSDIHDVVPVGGQLRRVLLPLSLKSAVNAVSNLGSIATEGERKTGNSAVDIGNTVFQTFNGLTTENAQKTMDRVGTVSQSLVSDAADVLEEGAERLEATLGGTADKFLTRGTLLNGVLSEGREDLGNTAAHAATTVNDARAALKEAVNQHVSSGLLEAIAEKEDFLGEVTGEEGSIKILAGELSLPKLPKLSEIPVLSAIDINVGPLGDINVGPLGDVVVGPLGDVVVGPLGDVSIGTLGDILSNVANSKIAKEGSLLASATAAGGALSQAASDALSQAVDLKILSLAGLKQAVTDSVESESAPVGDVPHLRALGKIQDMKRKRQAMEEKADFEKKLFEIIPIKVFQRGPAPSSPMMHETSHMSSHSEPWNQHQGMLYTEEPMYPEQYQQEPEYPEHAGRYEVQPFEEYEQVESRPVVEKLERFEILPFQQKYAKNVDSLPEEKSVKLFESLPFERRSFFKKNDKLEKIQEQKQDWEQEIAEKVFRAQRRAEKWMKVAEDEASKVTFAPIHHF